MVVAAVYAVVAGGGEGVLKCERPIFQLCSNLAGMRSMRFVAQHATLRTLEAARSWRVSVNQLGTTMSP